MRRYISLGAIAVFLICFFFLPLGIVFFRGIFAGEFPLAEIASILSSPYFLRIIGFTFFQAAVSACFALVLGLPGAFLVSRTTGRLKSVLNALATVPFILPAILVVLGFIIFFGNNGILNRALMGLTGSASPPLKILYNFGAIILAHGFYNFPVVLRIVSGAWETIPSQERFAARSLGAGKFREFRTVVVPRLLPPIAAAWFLSFLFCYLSFAIILVLAGGPRFTTMEVEIYRLTVTAVNIEEAAALGAVQVLLTASMMWVFTHFSTKKKQDSSEGIQIMPPEKSQNVLLKTGLFLYIIFAFLVVGGPILSVVIRSFQEPATRAGDIHFTLRWYREIFSFSGNSMKAAANTFLYALSTAFVSLLLGIFLAQIILRKEKGHRLIETLSMMPLGVSSVVLGLGYLFIIRFLPGTLFSPLLVIAAHTVIAYPFVLGTVKTYLLKVPGNLNHAAGLLGASPWRIFRTIEFPLIQPGIAAAGSFAFAISAGEMNATIMFNSAGVVTMPLVIYRYVGAYNYYGACAMGVILIVLSAAAFFGADYFSLQGRRYVSAA